MTSTLVHIPNCKDTVDNVTIFIVKLNACAVVNLLACLAHQFPQRQPTLLAYPRQIYLFPPVWMFNLEGGAGGSQPPPSLFS